MNNFNLASIIAFGVLIFSLILALTGFTSSLKGSGENKEIFNLPLKEIGVATFAGGCFWCMEPPFEKLPGTLSVISGYTGGNEKDPTYKQVSSGLTGHVEAVQIQYNPTKISYRDLLEVYWRNVDPTDAGGQFVDRGKQYKSGIFFHNESQKKLAQQLKKELEKSGRYKKKVITEIIKATDFYPAEDYHQNFFKKNSFRYKTYRFGSGRDDYIDKVWGKDRHYKPSQTN